MCRSKVNREGGRDCKGILDTKIASIILPLLADHVLREANHYIRLLETRSVH